MSVRLFVLGVVNERDVHGYEIKEIASLWGVERWANIGFGSIYHALGKLRSEDFIQERGVEQEGNRPPRSVYRITTAGRAAFFELLRETCRTAGTESRDIDMALAFLHHLPPGERVPLLTERMEKIIPRLTQLEEAIAGYEAARTSDEPQYAELRRLLKEAPWVLAGVKHSHGRVKFECDWMREQLASVADWPYRPE